MPNNNKKKQKRPRVNDRKVRHKKEVEYIQELSKQVHEFEGDKLNTIKKFTELPLSNSTLKGLNASHYVDLRDIQRLSVLPAIQGHDILGAAQTGSGKTLAFLIPILECLYRNSWTDLDGLGAMILSPTRELAIQTFEVLKRIGRGHQFSAALVVGGKDAQAESERLARVNILVGTPGRVVHHMHQSTQLDVSNLQMLVLDEADRILDEGFQKDVDAIVQDLPPRQTLLFSATQTKRVKDLARLSLKDPMYISPHNTEMITTPATLEQFYIVCEVDEKLNNLFAFIKSHLKSKLLVFFSSRKQVRFVYEVFRQMQPGIPLIQMHGSKKLTSRTEATDKFKMSKHACMFTTDVTARGVDIPGIDWVIQVDVAEDSSTYIHRVGRAARNEKKGRALLFLTPKEEPGFVKELEGRRVPISKQNVRQGRKKDITSELQRACYEDPEIKVLGQKALQSYVMSVAVRPNQEMFGYTVDDIPMERFAKSLGLMQVPNVKRLEKLKEAKARKNIPRALLRLDGSANEKEKKVKTKYERMFERKNHGVLSEDYMMLQEGNDEEANDDDDDEDFMQVKKHGAAHESLEAAAPRMMLEDQTSDMSKRAAKRALSKKLVAKEKPSGTKLVFDDEGEAHPLYEFQDEEDFKAAGDADKQKQEFVSKESRAMESIDVEDKAYAKEKRQERKRKRQEAERRFQQEAMGDQPADSGFVPVELPSDLDVSDHSDDEQPDTKKPKWYEQQPSSEDESDGDVLHVDEPETLEDLEALSSKLIARK